MYSSRRIPCLPFDERECEKQAGDKLAPTALSSSSPRSALAALALGTSTLGLFASPAAAQPTQYVPSEAFVSFADWTFVAIEGHANGTVSHNHLVAVSQTFAASTQSIVAVMYERQPDDSWIAVAWTEGDVAGVIPFLEGAFGIQPEHLHRLDPLGLPLAGEAYLSSPGAYQDGLFVWDPLAWALHLDPENRDALIEWLVEIGYPAADLPIEKNADAAGVVHTCLKTRDKTIFEEACRRYNALPPVLSPSPTCYSPIPIDDRVNWFTHPGCETCIVPY